MTRKLLAVSEIVTKTFHLEISYFEYNFNGMHLNIKHNTFEYKP